MGDQENEPHQAEPPSPEEMAKFMPPFPGGKKAHNALLMDDGPQKGAQLRYELEKNDWGVLEASSLYEAFQGMLRTDLDVIIVKPSSDGSAFSYARLLKERMEARSSSRNIPIAVVPGAALSKEAWTTLKSLSSRVFFYNSQASGEFSSFIDGLLGVGEKASLARGAALSPSAPARTSILDAIGIDTVLEAIMKIIAGISDKLRLLFSVPNAIMIFIPVYWYMIWVAMLGAGFALIFLPEANSMLRGAIGYMLVASFPLSAMLAWRDIFRILQSK